MRPSTLGRVLAGLFLLSTALELVGAARADLLHLKDGRKVVTLGPWTIVDDQVRYTTPIGRPGSVPVAEVDLERSRAASPASSPSSATVESKSRTAGKSGERIVLYETSWCPWCKRARELFAELGVPILERDVEADAAAAREKERLAPGTGVPVVVYGERVIRGFSEVELRKIAQAYRDRQRATPAPAVAN